MEDQLIKMKQGVINNYIPASPQENLLSPEVNQPPNVPDIFLDEEQLQQLHRDLAKFDQQLHFSQNLQLARIVPIV